MSDTSYTIAKRVVKKASDTSRGIAGEELTGDRDRTQFRKSHRDRLTSHRYGGKWQDWIAIHDWIDI